MASPDVHGASNLSKAQDVRGWAYFVYDAANRLTSETAPDGATVSQAYDEVGQRTSVTSPGGTTYYAYNATGRMLRAQAEDATVGTAYYAYDENGNVVKKVLGNGCFTYFAYDPANRVTSIRNCLADGSALAYFEYAYDVASRITRVGRENGDTIYYGYDNTDRLTSEVWRDSGAAQIYAFEWDYDLVGNRTYQKRGGVETYYEYDAGNELTKYHEMSADTWTYFAYDSRGNCTEIQEPVGTTYFEYSDADLVAMIKYPGATLNYFHYDALLRRYAIQDSGGLSYFTYDTDRLCPLAERDAAGSTVGKFTRGHAPVRGIGDLDASELSVGGTTYYQYPAFDHRGNVAAITDENGTEVGRFEYDAWGTKIVDTPPPEGTRFGQSAPAWLDIPDSGGRLALSFFRVFHKPSGRFLQRDPVGPGKRIRLYIYALNSPLDAVDPVGLTVELVDDQLKLQGDLNKNDLEALARLAKKRGEPVIADADQPILRLLVQNKWTFKYPCYADLKNALKRRRALIGAMRTVIKHVKYGVATGEYEARKLQKPRKGKHWQPVLEVIETLVEPGVLAIDCVGAVQVAILKMVRDVEPAKVQEAVKQAKLLARQPATTDFVNTLDVFNRYLKYLVVIGGQVRPQDAKYRTPVPGDFAYFRNAGGYRGKSYSGIASVMAETGGYLYLDPDGPKRPVRSDKIWKKLFDEYNKEAKLKGKPQLKRAQFDALVGDRPELLYEPDLDLRRDVKGQKYVWKSPQNP